MFENYILDRLSEASTWRGIIGLVTAAGVGINPDMVAGIVTVGMSLSGMVGALVKDK